MEADVTEMVFKALSLYEFIKGVNIGREDKGWTMNRCNVKRTEENQSAKELSLKEGTIGKHGNSVL